MTEIGGFAVSKFSNAGERQKRDDCAFAGWRWKTASATYYNS